MFHRTAIWLFFSALLLITAAVLLPNTDLSWMRSNWLWFNLSMGWIERANLPFNLTHAILFTGLGASARLSFARLRLCPGAWLMALFAGATELVQIWVPGRHARWSDFAVDLISMAFGAVLAHAFRRLLTQR